MDYNIRDTCTQTAEWPDTKLVPVTRIVECHRTVLADKAAANDDHCDSSQCHVRVKPCLTAFRAEHRRLGASDAQWQLSISITSSIISVFCTFGFTMVTCV
jgi:hypothetical protein